MKIKPDRPNVKTLHLTECTNQAVLARPNINKLDTPQNAPDKSKVIATTDSLAPTQTRIR